MTSRQMGRRMAGIAAQRRKYKKRGGKRVVSRRERSYLSDKEKSLTRKERQTFSRAFICTAVFVMLVVMKVFFPEGMAAFREKAVSLMQQNMDVEAVFSAVGRVFFEPESRDEVMKEVYRAVFHPQEQNQGQNIAVRVSETSCAMEFLHTFYAPPAENEIEEPASEGILYTQENIPEDASMEQAVLGFSYVTPLVGTLTSPFGYREHPVEGEDLFHYGIDLAANTGTTIGAFADGTMKAVGESSSYGKYCILQHDNGYSTLYAHCSKICVSSGASVKRGEKIAEVGKTGMATGSHLHFELMHGNTYLNPIYYVVYVSPA